LGFESLRTLERQFGLLDRRMLGLVDVHYCLQCGRTGGDHQTYTLQTVQTDERRITTRILLFGIPSG
jgi:hypothetical protein